MLLNCQGMKFIEVSVRMLPKHAFVSSLRSLPYEAGWNIDGTVTCTWFFHRQHLLENLQLYPLLNPFASFDNFKVNSGKTCAKVWNFHVKYIGLVSRGCARRQRHVSVILRYSQHSICQSFFFPHEFFIMIKIHSSETSRHRDFVACSIAARPQSLKLASTRSLCRIMRSWLLARLELALKLKLTFLENCLMVISTSF